MGGADNQAAACRTDYERSRAENEIFHYQEHSGSSFARRLKCPVEFQCYTGIKILETWQFFGLSPVIFETRSSEERTKPTYDALYWS